MGIFDIIGAGIILALLICFCLICARACQRKKQPRNRRNRRRQQKNARRKRRRQQRNCPHPPPTNPQTRTQMPNPPRQQQTSVPNPPPQPPAFQTVLPQQQYPNSSQPYLQFHNPQFPDLWCQPTLTQQSDFAQQRSPHANIAAQQEDLYPFAPPPYEPPDHMSSQRQLETRITMPGLDVSQFARPPPPPYDEELQRSEPFKLN